MAQRKEIIISEMDQYLFGQGNHYEIYKKLGAHPTIRDGKEGVLFAVWAPNARYVSVVGDFNGWDKGAHPMKKIGPGGIWEVFLPNISEGALYKYCVNNSHGWDILKTDPYGVSTEVRPGNASKVASIEDYTWTDGQWMKDRIKKDMTEEPMFIYEVHPGSWKKHPYKDDNPQGFYNYKEFASSLCDYVLEMGYTHVELIGIAEHPFDGSWGYQVTSYFAPTSRHGSPKEFMYLVDYLHAHGIGVILDWVPAHFPKDQNGLAEFDGTCLYEYADYQKANHPEWGTKIFDYGKNEVQNFLISNALYWVKEFHVDGLRVDAVASMLYLDFGRSSGQWTPNQYGDNRNLEAIDFIRHLNSVVETRGEGAMVIAEESTAWPQITGKTEKGGLGFSFKWNMGWMNDFLKYMELDPIYRQYHHQLMNFSMMYAYKENYIQVLSHDEVVHLKHSMIEKMPGPIWDKAANLRGAYTYMTGHPGKKLLFMGQDFGQLREWSEEREIDWFLLNDPRHRQLKDFMRDLIHLYRKHPCMYELDTKEEGFTWVNADDNERSIFSFERHSKDGKDNLLFICNFTPVNRMDYRVGAYKGRKYKLLLNSDAKIYGGGGMLPEKLETAAEEVAADNRDYSFAIPVPAYGALVFSFSEKGEAKKIVKKKVDKKICTKKETKK
ncbi:MAG: 1,4-alpha-glucan branching protein GlgB [Lachnospiraceae bacterium]|nr:1,4-alpha-glucan branching protein GlgB [Lachnospiraceae bacterium]